MGYQNRTKQSKDLGSSYFLATRAIRATCARHPRRPRHAIGVNPSFAKQASIAVSRSSSQLTRILPAGNEGFAFAKSPRIFAGFNNISWSRSLKSFGIASE